MRIAVITDIHSNREALTACLAHAESRGAKRFVFLGDFVGYGADPGWVVDEIAARVRGGAIAILGNHDEAVATPAESGDGANMHNDARTAIEWTRARLSEEQLEFLRRLPLSCADEDRLYVHANAWAPERWEYIRTPLEAERCLRATEQHIVFCGHTHEPLLFHLSPHGRACDFLPVPETPIPLSPLRQWLALPGSAGQPRDGNPAACYALVETQGGASKTLTFHRVPYDHDSTARKIREAGLPEYFAARLSEGV